MFIGTGAYTSVLLFKFFELSPWLGLIAGALVAVLVAFFIGLPTLRLHGAFFAVATVAFPLITYALLCNWGFEEIAIPFAGLGASSMYFTDIRSYVLLALVVLCVILIIVRKIESSRFGYSLKALKQNEVAAEAAGVDTFKTKLVAFMLSAGLGAIIGTVYAFSVLFVLTVHSAFGLFIIVRILAIGCVGGLGTLWGPVIAAGLLVPAGEFLNSQFGDILPGAQDIIYGAALIGAIIYMPDGIWGKIKTSVLNSRKIIMDTEVIPLPESEIRKLFEFEHLTHNIKVKNTETGLILKVENISKSFGGVKGLKNVNLEIPKNKVIGIIGPNGSGKTTLFNVIHGYLNPERGNVLFEGKKCDKSETT